MRVLPKFEVRCDKCGVMEIVAPDVEDSTEPCWPSWLRIGIVSVGGGAYALCAACKEGFWAWMKVETKS